MNMYLDEIKIVIIKIIKANYLLFLGSSKLPFVIAICKRFVNEKNLIWHQQKTVMHFPLFECVQH